MGAPATNVTDMFPQPAEESKPRPKFLSQIRSNASLTEIYVYSQRDFSLGASVAEKSRDFDTKSPPIPVFGDANLVKLGSSFQQADIVLALRKMKDAEDPIITDLRKIIVEAIEAKSLFNCAVKTADEANTHGIVFIDPYISDEGIPLGVMAFDG